MKVVNGELPASPPVGFIIDSPWLPGWFGCTPNDFYGSNKLWFEANLKAITDFPEATFLPGFWSEYGEINEPSAFGCKLLWFSDNLPHADKIIGDPLKAPEVEKPNVERDGLLPLMMSRLRVMEPMVRDAGHAYRFAIARGPFNIATFLMGATEFMMALVMHPDEMHALLRTITDFTMDWLRYQKASFPSMEGIMILDDLIGFVGDTEFSTFATPYLKEIFQAFDSPVRCLHNDADGLVTADHLEEIGVNMFNFSFKHSLPEMRERCGASVVLLGNIPPRDVFAQGSADQVRAAVQEAMSSMEDHRRIMWSVGGGVPQGVSSENMQAFIHAVKEF